MIRAIEMIAIGILCFVLAQELTANIILGSDIGSVVLQEMIPLAIAAGVAIAALLVTIKHKGVDNAG